MVYRIRRKRMDGSFPCSINDKRCLPFIVDRMWKNFFHSIPSNSVHRMHRCELGIILLKKSGEFALCKLMSNMGKIKTKSTRVLLELNFRALLPRSLISDYARCY